MYIDFAGDRLEVVDEMTGETKKAEFFVALLPFSHYTYCEAVWSQRKEDLIKGCENAMKLLYRSVYLDIEGMRFASLDGLNTAIHISLLDFNEKVMAGREMSRKEMFQRGEKDYLRPLPLKRYVMKERKFMTADTFLSMLLAREWDYRAQATIARLTKNAAFGYKAYLEQIDYATNRGLERNQMERLATLDFVHKGQDLFITGSSGTGKSYLACALGHEACKRGFRTLYANAPKLLGALKVAKVKGTLETELKKIERCQLLILDRIIHTAHTIELYGESMRKLRSKKN